MKAAVLLCVALLHPAAPELVDAVAAVVGRRVITRSEVDIEARIALIRRGGAGQLQTPIDDELRGKVLETIVLQEMLAQESRRRGGLSAGEADVDKGVASLQLRMGGESGMRAFMLQSGSDVELIRALVRRDLMVQALLHRVLPSPGSIPEADVRSWLQAHPNFYKGMAEQSREVAARSELAKERSAAAFARFVEQLREQVEVRYVASWATRP